MEQLKQKSSVSSRLQALWWLSSVIKDGRSVNDVLSIKLKKSADLSDFPFAKQLLFGSLRYFHQIKAILDQLLEKQLKQKDLDVYSILIIGVYQLRHLSVPDHAAISESVELAKKIKKPWAASLVNGILRNYLRQLEQIENKLAKAKTFQFSHPNWIINQLEIDWGEQYQSIMEQNNRQAPMVVRVNQAKICLEDYIQELEGVGLKGVKHPVAQDALVLESACDVHKLPGFETGLVSVQDAAPQLVVELLDLDEHTNLDEQTDNLKVLDGCSAPGGKTAHILQRYPAVALTSVEMSEKRIQKIEQTLLRLGLDKQPNFKLLCSDLLDLEQWWDGELFDRILIDVPCSASGVIRRNPDIKLHRKKQDLTNIVQLQAEILGSAWSILKPGGKLVYATCSIFKDENENQINKFLSNHDAKIYRLSKKIDEVLSGHSQIGYQILPGELQMDGFYLCGLEKPL